MNDFDENDELDVLFNANFPEDLLKNHRIATRFIRADIDASVSDLGFFYGGKVFAVNLIDITSKGVLIESEKKLKINQKLTLTLKFKTGKTFVIKAKVVRIADNTNNRYGIKFDRYNNELGEYLLETQTKLVFK
ncbi:PilZ domain-containing protein [Methylovulum miyakonense]|uniref:PilZ domain-containing protein n=1 Tax=Methylovulum miyakonense TaxID=645578 RepID=UPI00037FBBF1|nr:PilZ domain-containing protein [Methylovulum miyakonense]